ncbi:MAG: hypothetical protein U9Q92_04135 [archaeon]|nr:hypothetical protein [archaeon]
MFSNQKIYDNLEASGVDGELLKYLKEHDGEISLNYNTSATIPVENGLDGATDISMSILVESNTLWDIQAAELPDDSPLKYLLLAEIHIDSSEKIVRIHPDPVRGRIARKYDGREERFVYTSSNEIPVLEPKEVSSIYNRLKEDLVRTLQDFRFIIQQV